MTRKAKIFIWAFCPLAPFVLSYLFFELFCSHLIVHINVDKNFANYERHRNDVTGAYDLLPGANDFGEYESISFSYKKSYRKYLQTEYYDINHGLALKIDYNDDNYILKKDYIDSKYNFIDKTYTIYYDNNYHYSYPVTSFVYKDINFRIAINEYDLMYENITSQSFIMIGQDDENKCFYFLYYYNGEKRYICNMDLSYTKRELKMRTLVKKNFCWI